jgi:PhnB protein
MQLTPYIMFNGTCEEALNFYAKALNGEIKELHRFEGSPAEGMSTDKQKVMHAHFAANGIFFMASDGDQKEAVGGMVHLSLNFDNAEELGKVFAALSEGARVTMPLQDTFWGARFGMLTDQFGINWMFNQDKQ